VPRARRPRRVAFFSFARARRRAPSRRVASRARARARPRASARLDATKMSFRFHGYFYF
jgi:hypothetical protein